MVGNRQGRRHKGKQGSKNLITTGKKTWVNTNSEHKKKIDSHGHVPIGGKSSDGRPGDHLEQSNSSSGRPRNCPVWAKDVFLDPLGDESLSEAAVGDETTATGKEMAAAADHAHTEDAVVSGEPKMEGVAQMMMMMIQRNPHRKQQRNLDILGFCFKCFL